ncbi:WYL domain-containing protein [Phytoactinopolyspora halotolerans]|uniref:WYL domain-containing protein n=1 Tax=Phytoactinopolyspora halotolerans TaxID=1981512 RepID=A0A6L9SFC7_9ACTN|nr:WYL domain-containing protein [Phytoactinopolyspora halotolerans]NEE03763.1 WYL domain-containing protein [Phytoactinopolyspora halotolerans]
MTLEAAEPRGLTTDDLIEIAGYGSARDPERQLNRDVTELKRIGWDIRNESGHGAAGRYRLHARDTRLRVEIEPQHQVQLVRAALAAGVGDEFVDRLGDDLFESEPPGDEPLVRTNEPHRLGHDALDKAAYAVENGCLMRFVYKQVRRVVHPYLVHPGASGWYLVGHEDGSSTVKRFVTGRMTDVVVDGPDTAVVPEDVTYDGLNPITWEVDPPTAVVVETTEEYVPQAEMALGTPVAKETDDDGMVRLTIPVTHRAAFRARLYELGERVRIVESAEVREEIISELSRFLKRQPLTGGPERPLSVDAPPSGPRQRGRRPAGRPPANRGGRDHPASSTPPDPRDQRRGPGSQVSVSRPSAPMTSGAPNRRPPGYVRRFDRVTRALNLLAMHANGLPLRQLAASLDIDPDALLEELRAYYSADMPLRYYPPVVRPTTIRFHDADGAEVLPDEAEYVTAVPHPTVEVGADYVSVSDLARVYQAGQNLMALEPGNTDLEDALDALMGTALRGLGAKRSEWQTHLAARLGDALRQRRKIRITYARAWEPGVVERVIMPFRLTTTRRGWELDAAIDDERTGTFLLSGIRDVEILDEAFERPADVEERIAANRKEQAVYIAVPQDRRWVVERFAESVEVVRESDDEVRLRAYLLGPVEKRLALLMVVAGPRAFVYEPTGLRDAGTDLARRLLRHHRGP